MLDLSQRVNCISMVIYEADYPKLIDVLDSPSFYSCKYYCICHDKDIDDLGELKKLHYHVVIKLDTNISIDKIVKALDIEILNNNVNVLTIVKNCKAMIRYLIHCDNNDKYKYDISEIYTNDIHIKDYFVDSVSYSQISCIYDYLAQYEIHSLYGLVNKCIELNDFQTLEYIEGHSYLINNLIRYR